MGVPKWTINDFTAKDQTAEVLASDKSLGDKPGNEAKIVCGLYIRGASE